MIFRKVTMFCPKCGSNQGEGKKFCTVCGTNLAAVSQALTGRLPPPAYYAPPMPHPLEIERQRQMAKGVRLAIIGGSLVALKLIGFLFSGMFRGDSLIGPIIIAGFILLAIGISKIVNSRPPAAAIAQNAPVPMPQPEYAQANPHPVFSAVSTTDREAPRTSELEPVRYPAPSVTEEETQHLPHRAPPHEFQR